MRRDINGAETSSSLEDVLKGAFNEFRLWTYWQKHHRTFQSTSLVKIDRHLPFIIAGYLDNHDCHSAIDELASPHHTGQCPPTDLIIRLLELIHGAGEEMASAQIYSYLRRLFSELPVYTLVSEIVQSFRILGRYPGWPSLVRLMKEGTMASYRILHLLLMLFRDEALSHCIFVGDAVDADVVDPNVADGYVCKLAGLAEEAVNTGSRGNDENYWGLCMSGFQPEAIYSEKLASLAHDYLELGYVCLSLSGAKASDRFISNFYDNGLLRNTDNEQQRLFFDSCEDSHAAVQVAFHVLSRKFNIGPGPSFDSSYHPQHLGLLSSLVKLAKTRVNLTRAPDQLQYAAFLCAIRPFFSPSLSAFQAGPKRLPLHTLTELDAVKQVVAPLLKRKDKAWNPYLVPYRVLFGKMEVEVIVIGSSCSSDEEAVSASSPRSLRAKRTRNDPDIID